MQVAACRGRRAPAPRNSRTRRAARPVPFAVTPDPAGFLDAVLMETSAQRTVRWFDVKVLAGIRLRQPDGTLCLRWVSRRLCSPGRQMCTATKDKQGSKCHCRVICNLAEWFHVGLRKVGSRNVSVSGTPMNRRRRTRAGSALPPRHERGIRQCWAAHFASKR